MAFFKRKFQFSIIFWIFLFLIEGHWNAEAVRLKRSSKRSCRSRKRQHFFWKDAKVRPPLLQSSLEKYEKFHKSCRSREPDLGKAFLNNETLPCKYLIWMAPYDGMGNRVLSFVSTFLLALTTNRVLVTDRRWKWEELFCEPLKKSSILLDISIRTDLILSRATFLNDVSDRIWESNGESNGEELISDEDIPYSIVSYITHEPDMRAFCRTEFSLLSKPELLIIHSNMYYVPGLYFTPVSPHLRELFPNNDVFVYLSRYLLNPQNKVWRNIVKYYRFISENATQTLGLQIRTFDHPWSLEKSERLLKCTNRFNLLPSISEKGGEGEDRRWRGGEGEGEEGEGEGEEGKPQKIVGVVASLHQEFYQNLALAYEKSNKRGKTDVSVFRAGQSSSQQSELLAHNQEVVLEIFLLSFCDHLITSPGSTFGYIASGLSGKVPYFLNGLFHTDSVPFNGVVCTASVSTEPCFHSPPLNQECRADKKKVLGEPWDKRPYVRQCTDFPRGVRLVP